MEEKFILSIDQGTTGTTAQIAEVSDMDDLKVVGRSTINFPQHFPKSDWVEHDLEEIWGSVVQAVKEACAQAETQAPLFKRQNIVAIGITNQRETLCIYERKSLKPLCRAIVWQCKRSSSICQMIKQDGIEKNIRKKTGLLVDPYFTGTKIRWVMENNPEIARSIKNGTAVIGTIDTYLISKLGKGKDHATEASNASRTLIYNIEKGGWDDELIQVMGLPNKDALPEIKNSADLFTRTKGLDFLPDEIPITGVLGDQQAALAGQRCFSFGEAKCTYGTGAFLLLNIGDKPLLSKQHLLTTVAWQLDGKQTYALEGSSFIAGAAFQFLRDKLGFLTSAWESESLARGAVAAPEVYFVPALAGLGAPWWEPEARGAFLGLTRATTREQLIRASLEGVAFQVCDLIESMKGDYRQPFHVLRVDGGAAANSLLMEIQAQLAEIRVERPANLETTGMGAILFAGLGAKIFDSVETLKKSIGVHSSFEPSVSKRNSEWIQKQKEGWVRAVKAVRLFSES